MFHVDPKNIKFNNLMEHCLGGSTGNVMTLTTISRATGVDGRHLGESLRSLANVVLHGVHSLARQYQQRCLETPLSTH